MSEQRRARTALGERPEGSLSGLYHDNLLRQNVALNHGFAEGIVPQPSAVWNGYDRNEHPWMHGRRATDLIEKAREVIGRGE